MAKSRKPVAPRKKSAPAKSASGKPAAKSAPRTAAKSRARTSQPKAAAAPRVHGGYEIICSECYSEFDFQPGTNASQITCPVCMHVGTVAERDDQARFQMAKGRERKKFLGSLVPGLLFVIVGLAWVLLLNQKGSGEELGVGMNYGLLGASMILLIITVWQGVKYEAARYEVYF